MTSDGQQKDASLTEQLIAGARRARAEREKEYREQALRLFPHLCARCGREFAGRKLRELTVHHKDHNHDNNPADGSNWELLCIYCHDNEHSRYLDSAGRAPEKTAHEPAVHQLFANLKSLLKDKE